MLAVALRSGPVELTFPGGNLLKVGSESFVMSNYSFHDGSTYFLDFDGGGVRSILQLHYLSDDKQLELVFHHADKDQMEDHQLITLPAP